MIALQPFLRVLPRGADLLASMPRFANALPAGVSFDDDVWNLAQLQRQAKTKTFNVDFQKIGNRDLRLLAKIRVAELIAHKKIGATAASFACSAFAFLAEAIQARPVTTLTSGDFHHAESILRRKSPKRAIRILADLARHCIWLNLHLGRHLVYKAPRPLPVSYGRAGTDAGRSEKLIPNTVLAKILSYRANQAVSERDRFYLSALAIAISTGLRISELMTLPADCLVKDERALLIRHFPAKNGRESARPVVDALRDVVEDAVAFIRAYSEAGRDLARQQHVVSSIDWRSILASGDTTIISYFVRRWAKAFIEDPNNRLLATHMAWNSNTSTWLPIEEAFERNKGNISATARELGVGRETISKLRAQTDAAKRGEVYLGAKNADSLKSFDTDRRVVSVQAFTRTIGIKLHRSVLIASIIQEAAWAQIRQMSFDAPPPDFALETKFGVETCVLRDPDTGRVVLAAKDALFVILRNQLSQAHGTSSHRFVVLGANHLNHWLAGYSRDRGTGKETDAIFNRLGILDPQTGDIAKFTIHDIRHWLNTAYEDGGLTQDQIGILFNRKSNAANASYLHTCARVRAERLKQTVREGIAIGHVPEAYAGLAQDSPAEAEAFLAATTKFYNPMPHGVCLLNWAAEVCPHAMSCFSCAKEEATAPIPCEHLIVDKEDPEQIAEIERINRNAAVIASLMAEDGMTDSPQFTHFEAVRRSTDTLLGEFKE